MRLTQFFDFDAIKPCMPASTKRGLFGMLAQVAGPRLGVDPAVIAAALSEREKLGSTGLGGGVAIPHGRLAGLTRIYAMVARLPEPINYKAIDGAPVDLVFLLLSPPEAGAEHLKALARVARRFRDRRFVEKLRGAGSPDAIYALMTADEARDAA